MLTALKALQLKARHQVYTLLSGQNLSTLHGEGYDFSELREYQVGDDIRKINWTATAKLGKPYIKELHANRELSVAVCALMDGSLYFGTGNDKQQKLTEVATLLGYAALQNGDLFTGVAYTQEGALLTPPTKQQFHIDQFSEQLYTAPIVERSIDHQNAINDLFGRLLKPSLVFILGDFLEPLDLSILSQKHEVIVISVRTREEIAPKVLGELTLVSPRGEGVIESYFGKRNIQQYLQKLHAHDEQFIKHCSTYDIRHLTLLTDESSISRLMTLFI